MAQTITVNGMSCEGCEATVTDALESVSGVTEANVDHQTDSAVVEGDAPIDALVAAIEDAGYEVDTEA